MRTDVISFWDIDIPVGHTLRIRHEEFISECLNGDHGETAQETMKLLNATIDNLSSQLLEVEEKITKIEDCDENPW